MDLDDGRRALEAGLAASWVRQAGWVPNSSLRHLGGILVVLTGVRDHTQQVAVVEGPIPDPEASVIAAEICFDHAGWRPGFDLVAGAHPDVEEVLRSRGFSVIVARPGMIRSTGAPIPDVAAEVGIELGVSRDREQIIAVQQDAFDLDPDTARGMVSNPRFRDPDAAILVARDPRTGQIVGSVTLHLSGPLGAFIGLAVVGSARRQGVGSALTAAAIEVARAHEVEALWLQATPDGAGLYRRLGFVEVGSCEVWSR